MDWIDYCPRPRTRSSDCVKSNSDADTRSHSASHVEESLAILRELGAAYQLARTYAAYGRLHRQEGRLSKARDCLTRALDILERLGVRIDSARVGEELARLAGS